MTNEVASLNKGDPFVPMSKNAIPLFGLEIFWRARYLRSSAYLEHIPFIFWLVTNLLPARCVTLGLAKGTAHFAVCQAAEKLGLDMPCYGIDVVRGEGAGEGAKKNFADLQGYNAEEYADVSRLVQARATAAAELFEAGSVDILLVDMELSDDLIEALATNWLPRMSERGVILLAGGARQSLGSQMRRRLRELGRGRPRFEFEHGGGLLILLVGSREPERLKQFMALDGAGPGQSWMRQVFRRLGAQYALELAVKEEEARSAGAESALQEMRETLAGLEAARDELQAKLENLNQAYAERHRVAATLQAEIFDYQTQAQSQAARAEDAASSLEAARSRQEELETALTAHRAELAELHEQAVKQQAQLSDQQAQINDAKVNLATVEGALSEVRSARDGLQGVLAESRGTIAELEGQVASRNAKYKTLKQSFEASISELEATKAGLIAGKGALDEAKATRDKLLAQLGEGRAALTRVEGQLATRDAEAEALKQALEIASSELGEIRASLAAREEAFAEARANRDLLLARLGESQAAAAKLEAQLELRDAELEKLRQTLEASARELAEVEAARAALQAELAETRSALEAQMEARDEEIEKLKRDIEVSAAGLDEAGARLAEREATLAEAEAARAALQAELAETRSVLAAQTAARDDEIAELKRDIEVSAAGLDEAGARLAEREATLAEAEAARVDLQAELAETRSVLAAHEAVRGSLQAELAETRSVLAAQTAMRDDEIAALKQALDASSSEREEARAALAAPSQEAPAAVETRDGEQDELATQLIQRDLRIGELVGDLDRMRGERDGLAEDVKARVDELVALTQHLEVKGEALFQRDLRIGELVGDLERVRGERDGLVEDVKARVDELVALTQHLEARGEALSHVSGLKDQLEAKFRASSETSRKQIGGYETEIGALRARVAAAEHRSELEKERAERIKRHLSYRLGGAIVAGARSPIGILKLPFSMWRAYRDFRADQRAGLLSPEGKAAKKAAGAKRGLKKVAGVLAKSKKSSQPSLPDRGAISYWARQLTADPEQLKWFVMTATKTKSVGARDVLAFAGTGGRHQYDDLAAALERVRTAASYRSVFEGVKQNFWRAGLRGLARLLYCQRLSPADLENAKTLYDIIIDVWGETLLDEFDRSYYADLLVDFRFYDQSRKFLEQHKAKNAERRTSQRFLKLNAINPFLPGSKAKRRNWQAELNGLYAKHGLAPIMLAEGSARPFYRLSSTAPRLPDDIPLVSVIMPIYEPDDSTDLALTSLLNQSWWNLEIIVVDDASPAVDENGKPTDYRKRLKAWRGRDPRLHIVFNKENRGAYGARNTGYDLAKGKYVTVADKDDWHHPQKLALQAQDLENHPEKIANITNWVRVDEDLRFLVRWGPDRTVCPSFASIMFRREEIREKLGYWDDVRKSADGEFKFRLQAHYGIDLQPEEPLPLAFSLMGENNLTAQDLGLGFEDDDRRAYRTGYRGWHEQIASGVVSPYLGRSGKAGKGRKFPAPHSFLPARPDYEPFDVVYLSEFGFEAGNTTSLRNEILVALDAGLRVAVVPCYNFLIRSASLRHMTPEIQELIDQGRITRLPLSAVARTRLLVIRWPAIMQVTHGAPSQLAAESIVVVANHPPAEETDNRVSYEVPVVTDNVVRLFGKRPTWVPQSEQILKMLSPAVPAAELESAPWKGILPAPLPALRVPVFSGLPVIGRHGRDTMNKWPSTRRELLAAYPINGSVKVSILGGANAPVKQGLLTRAEQSNWTVYGFNAIPVSDYLSGLDFFVYFHNDGWVEAFGMSILEAMAHGCVCLLPPHFEPVFGDAAVYLKADRIQKTVHELWSNPERYLAQQRRGRQFVDANASPAAYVARLARFGVAGP